MTNDTTIDPKNQESQDENNLEEILSEVQMQAEQKEKQKKKSTTEELEQKIKELESKLTDAEQIAKKAQSDYIHMKFDFDSYMRRNDEQNKTAKIDTLIDVVKKFTPFINSLRQSLENIPEETKDDVLVQGVQMVYKKFLSSLESMGIKTIESIGLTPDSNLHEAVSAMPTEDKDMKGKIIQEFEQGFMYEKGDIHKVITTSKVVIGQ